MVTMTNSREECLARFGFSFERGGTHLARSMMLDDLRRLLDQTPDANATRDDFARAIIDDNCLGKRSSRTRAIALRHLKSLYGLDRSIPLFRAMRHFWGRDPEGRPLLACLMAYARDSILRQTAPFILRMQYGQTLLRSDLEEFLDLEEEGRFSKATLQSTVRNVAATWTHAGHLAGRSRKVRTTAFATPGTVSFALLMGYISGARGETLFETEYAKLLDCSPDRAIELAESASRRGWIVVKRIGSVIEVLFPNLLNAKEQEWVREQS
jgi:hypothetical protein